MPSLEKVVYQPPGKEEITLHYPTVTFTVMPVYSTDSNIVAYQHIVTVRATHAAPSVSELRTDILNFRAGLSTPRGILTVFSGNAIFFKASPDTDLRFGPRPTNLEISEIHGLRSARITWQISTEVRSQLSVANRGAWVDFVYTIDSSLDDNLYTVRSIAGALRINSMQVTETNTADSYRQSIYDVCPCPDFWQRVSATWHLSEDHSILSFRIVDQQRYKCLPEGVTSGDAEVTVQSSYDSGRITKTLSGFYEAPAGISPSYVWNAFVNCWYGVFGAGTTTPIMIDPMTAAQPFAKAWCLVRDSGIIPRDVSIRRSLYRNRIDFAATIDYIPPTRRLDYDPAKPYYWTTQYDKDTWDFLLNAATVTIIWLNQCWTDRKQYDSKYPATSATGRSLVSAYGRAAILGPCGAGKVAPAIALRAGPELVEFIKASSADSKPPITSDDKKEPPKTEAAKHGILSYRQHVAYMIRTGKRAIPVKGTTEVAGKELEAPDIVQRVHWPQTYALQTGECIALSPNLSIPDPIYDCHTADKVADLIECEIALDSPSQGGKFKASWRYLMKLNQAYRPIGLRIPETALVVTDAEWKAIRPKDPLSDKFYPVGYPAAVQ